MAIRSGINAPAVLVDKYINSAYDTVKAVADNLEAVTTVGDYLNDPATAGDITAVADAINGDVAAAEAAANTATTAKNTAVEAATQATEALVEFKNIYLGSFSSDEAVEAYLTSNAMSKNAGDLYFNSVNTAMYVWSGNRWQTVGVFGVTKQVFTATNGQTVFGLQNGVTYIPGSNNIQVYVDGLLKVVDPITSPGTQDYVEATENTIVFNSGLTAGQEVVLVIGEFLSNTQLGVTTTTQVITATEGQTVVPVNSYVQGIGNIKVYVQGVFQPSGVAYTETSTTTITFTEPLDVGSQVVVIKGDILTNITMNTKAETEVFTITVDGTTEVELQELAYLFGNQNLQVYLNGSKQIVDVSYTENTDGVTITFLEGLNIGDKVECVVGNLTSTVQHDVTALVDRLADYESNTGASYIGYTPSGTNAVPRTVQSKLREFVSVKDFGAVGDGEWDDTAAIQAAHAASLNVHYPRGTYKINWTESTPLVTYSNATRIRITGDGALLYDTRTYAANSVSAVFQFTTCIDVLIDGLNYEGQPIADKSNATTGIGYRGATFVNLSTNCENITVNADLRYLRYGVRGGDYSLPSLGYNNNLKAKLTTFECGYPVAIYLSDGVDFDITAEGSHRSAYLAGVRGGRCHARFKNQYIAPTQVVLSDATTNGNSYPTGTSRGCSNLDIKAHDMGSTTWIANSFCAGISMSRGDPVLFEDLKFDVYVKSNDTTAATLSAFTIFNNFTPSQQPSYPNNWESTFVFRNIKLTGTLDRSDQTITENSSNGEIYIYATDNTRNGVVQGLDIEGFRYYPGTGAKTRGFWFFAPGMVGTSRIESCDFGTTTPVLLATNSSSVLSVSNTQLRGSYTGTSDSPYNSNIAFTDCVIADPAHQPLTNKTFYNTTLRGSKTAVVTKIIDAALSGASVTLSAAIPAGCVVVGVSGIVTTAITGATGFEVGVSGDTTRYANKFVVAQGTLITAVTDSSATAPINYISFTNLVVTPKTSNFTGGVLRLAIHYISFTNLTL